jgi:hypothetical protein
LALRWVAKASRPLIDLYDPVLARDVGQVVVASRAHDLPGVPPAALGLIQLQLRIRSGQPSAAPGRPPGRTASQSGSRACGESNVHMLAVERELGVRPYGAHARIPT